MNMLDDLRRIARHLRRRPVEAVVTILLVGPAVGAATVGLSLYYTLVIRPLPLPEAEQLIEIWESNALTPEAVDELPVGTALFADLESRTDLFDGVAAMLHHNAPYTGINGSDRFRRAVLVTSNFFDVLGVSTAIGSGIRTGETADAAVLSHGFWQDEYGGADDVVGRTLRVSLGAPQERHTITGILPAGLWLPPILLRSQDAMVEPQVFFNMPRSPHGAVIARMRPGVTIERVRADLDRMTADIRASAQAGSYFETVALRTTRLVDLRSAQVGAPARYLALATMCLLIAAGLTVAGLALSQAPEQRQHVALCAALGASRRQLVRQACVSAAIVAGAAALLGGALAYWGSNVLATVTPPGFDRTVDAGLGRWSFGLLAALWVGIGLLLAAVPLAAVWRAVARPALRTSRGEPPPSPIAGGVIAFELAACVVLLVATGLTLSKALTLSSVDTGYDAERVVTLDVTVPQFPIRSRSTASACGRRSSSVSAPSPASRPSGAATPCRSTASRGTPPLFAWTSRMAS